jgi:hypothetical protein
MSTRKISFFIFVLYYKKYIKHFFRMIYSYINTRGNWENTKLMCENTQCFTQFRVFPIPTRVDITVYQHGKCFIFVKYYLASIWFIRFSSYSKMDRGFQEDFYKYRWESDAWLSGQKGAYNWNVSTDVCPLTSLHTLATVQHNRSISAQQPFSHKKYASQLIVL